MKVYDERIEVFMAVKLQVPRRKNLRFCIIPTAYPSPKGPFT